MATTILGNAALFVGNIFVDENVAGDGDCEGGVGDDVEGDEDVSDDIAVVAVMVGVFEEVVVVEIVYSLEVVGVMAAGA